MRCLLAIFVAMTIYGVVAGKYGGALFSSLMIVVVYYGARELDKRDAEFEADPRSAKRARDTRDLLVEKEVEASSSRL